MSAVRLEAKKDTFRGARLDALVYKLCPCHALFMYIADCEGSKFHTKNDIQACFFFQVGWTFIAFFGAILLHCTYFHSKFLNLLLFSDYELLCEGSQASHA